MERLQHNISTNIVDDDHKKDAFLACIGNETLGLLQALVVPAKLGDKTYDELVVALTAHFVHTPLINSRKIQVSQMRTKRRLGLKKLAEDCKFGETLTETCGTLNENVQKRRITKVNLTFAKALEATEITKQAAKDAKQLLRTDNPSDVHQVLQAWQADKHNKGSTHCYRYGRNHQSHTCWFKEDCRFCHKKGSTHCKGVSEENVTGSEDNTKELCSYGANPR